MEESYLAGLLVSFLFAFVLFKKDKTITEKTVNKRSISSSYHKASSTTATGVAKYLANKDVGVSGVSKYMARQSTQAQKSVKENISGVEKYLNNRS